MIQMRTILEQPTLHSGDPRGGPIALPSRVGFGVARGDNPGAILGVVESDHPVVHTDGQIGDAELVEPWPWQLLDGVLEAVAEQAGNAPLKRRQVGSRREWERGQATGHLGERVGRRVREPHDRVGGDERVSAPIWVPIRAVQEQQVRQAGKAARDGPRVGGRRQFLGERENAHPV